MGRKASVGEQNAAGETNESLLLQIEQLKEELRKEKEMSAKALDAEKARFEAQLEEERKNSAALMHSGIERPRTKAARVSEKTTTRAAIKTLEETLGDLLSSYKQAVADKLALDAENRALKKVVVASNAARQRLMGSGHLLSQEFQKVKQERDVFKRDLAVSARLLNVFFERRDLTQQAFEHMRNAINTLEARITVVNTRLKQDNLRTVRTFTPKFSIWAPKPTPGEEDAFHETEQVELKDEMEVQWWGWHNTNFRNGELMEVDLGPSNFSDCFENWDSFKAVIKEEEFTADGEEEVQEWLEKTGDDMDDFWSEHGGQAEYYEPIPDDNVVDGELCTDG